MRKTQPKSGRLRIRYERRADIRASGPATEPASYRPRIYAVKRSHV